MVWRAAAIGAWFAFAALAAGAQGFDRNRSRIGFELQTRWGQRLQGIFPTTTARSKRWPTGAIACA